MNVSTHQKYLANGEIALATWAGPSKFKRQVQLLMFPDTANKSILIFKML